MSKLPFIARDNPGEMGIAMGNEAIARGLLEAGVVVGAGYPGTPSTEILENFTEIKKVLNLDYVKVEWSINEAVGFEVAFAASMSNARAIATMKHVGLNVAADPFFTACYAGAKGGFVFINADDPSLHSSQNEQDNRYYALHALIPMFEPSNPQEAKDMLVKAYDFSEQYETVVMFRTTTRLNHARGNLKLGPIKKLDRLYQFDHESRSRWVHLPSIARVNRQKLLDRLDTIKKAAETFEYNKFIKKENAKLGILTYGVPYAHLVDALAFLGISDKVSILKLGMTYPQPEEMMAQFASSVQKILVLEELEPFQETALKKLCFERKINVEIIGKGFIPQKFELTPELIVEKVAEFVGVPNPIKKVQCEDLVQPPPRPPVLCAGCSHRSFYYALNQVEKEMKTRFVKSSDIGCYTLGYYPPVNGIDTCICMGASIGIANGIAKLDSRPVFAILGDSTFFHSGVPALINAVYNKNDFILCILDNLATAMTGHQDHPGTGVRIDRGPGVQVSIERLVEGIGVPKDHIWTLDAFDVPAMIKGLTEAVQAKGMRVCVVRTKCALLQLADHRAKKTQPVPYQINQERCKKCRACLTIYGCPAFTMEGDTIKISKEACIGCGTCVAVCKFDAIERCT
jgi:indolepyruvate ferredoxin oxidoreductase alpha subunit